MDVIGSSFDATIDTMMVSNNVEINHHHHDEKENVIASTTMRQQNQNVMMIKNDTQPLPVVLQEFNTLKQQQLPQMDKINAMVNEHGYKDTSGGSSSSSTINTSDPKKNDELLFGSLPSRIYNEFYDVTMNEISKGITTLPLLSSTTGGEIQLMNTLQKTYWKNIDLFTLYCQRNLFTIQNKKKKGTTTTTTNYNNNTGKNDGSKKKHTSSTTTTTTLLYPPRHQQAIVNLYQDQSYDHRIQVPHLNSIMIENIDHDNHNNNNEDGISLLRLSKEELTTVVMEDDDPTINCTNISTMDDIRIIQERIMNVRNEIRLKEAVCREETFEIEKLKIAQEMVELTIQCIQTIDNDEKNKPTSIQFLKTTTTNSNDMNDTAGGLLSSASSSSSSSILHREITAAVMGCQTLQELKIQGQRLKDQMVQLRKNGNSKCDMEADSNHKELENDDDDDIEMYYYQNQQSFGSDSGGGDDDHVQYHYGMMSDSNNNNNEESRISNFEARYRNDCIRYQSLDIWKQYLQPSS